MMTMMIYLIPFDMSEINGKRQTDNTYMQGHKDVHGNPFIMYIIKSRTFRELSLNMHERLKINLINNKYVHQTFSQTRMGVFAQGQILCISPNGLQTGHCDAPHTPPPLFWITENEFWSPFLAISDQYSTLHFVILFTKWLPVAILDDRKSLSIAFLTISDQYATLIFFLNS